MNTTISIIIPHLKDFNILSECLESITYNKEGIETIVVNNNCQDNSIAKIKNIYTNIKIINLNKNKGYAGGCNEGAKHAKGKYLLFLNNDTIIENDCINALLNIISSSTKISSVQPKIKNFINRKSFDYAGACGGYIDYLGYPFARGRIFNTIEDDNKQYDKSEKIFWASGTAFMTRKNIFNSVGGFDEKFFAHMEEIDYHWKCLKLGYDIYVEPEAVIYHRGAATLSEKSFLKNFLNHRNSLIIFLSNHNQITLKMICHRFLLEKISILYYLLTGRIKKFFGALGANLWILFNIRYIVRRRRKIKLLIPKPHIISKKLMKRYSIVKKYFLRGIKFYKDIN